MTKTQLQQLAKNKIFTATFIKANGELRTLNCRLNVKKYLKGGISTVVNRDDLITVFDMQINQYRNIPLDRLIKLNINGETIAC